MLYPSRVCCSNPRHAFSFNWNRYHSAMPCFTRRIKIVVAFIPSTLIGSSVANSGIPANDRQHTVDPPSHPHVWCGPGSFAGSAAGTHEITLRDVRCTGLDTHLASQVRAVGGTGGVGDDQAGTVGLCDVAGGLPARFAHRIGLAPCLHPQCFAV